MNEIVGDVSTTKDELIMKKGAISSSTAIKNNNNNKKENLLFDNNIRNNNSVSTENLILTAADRESVTASSGFSTNIDQDGGLVGVESLSHVSSLNCFEVESAASAGGGGGGNYSNEVEPQQQQDSSPWDVDTSEKVYLSTIRDTRASGNNIPESGRINTGKYVEDGISKESYDAYTPANVPNNTTSRGRNNKGVVGSVPMNASAGQGCTGGGISILNAMQFGGLQQQQDVLDTRIDSALLSALNDPKERMGLLRLEQVLIEFMNDRSIMYMDVGGPANSMVLKEGTTAQSRSYQEENNRGRQTSFQRLCLHRLADRFNIVREALPSPSCDDYYMGGGVTPSLIRLVKMNDSMIPSKLLIDLDLSSLDDKKQRDAREVDGSSASLSKNTLTELTASFSTSSLNASASSAGGAGDVVLVGQKQEKPRRKMKIMKRRSGDGSNNNDGKDKKNHNKNKGKKLSDKEKAYAEARARIFNELEEKRRAESLVANASSGSPPPATFNRDTTSPPSPAPSSVKSDSINLDAGSDPNPNLVYEADPDYADQQSSNKNPNSKVTWRNRRQEENDPDFRRGNVVRSVPQQSSASTVMSQGVPYVTAHGVFVSPHVQSSGANYMHPQTLLNTDHSTSYKQSTAGYPQQQMYYPPQVNSSNPYVQQPYYPQQQQYYTQSSNSNQSSRSIRQPYHQTLYSSNGNNNSTNTSRKENIVYNMEEFPPIG